MKSNILKAVDLVLFAALTYWAYLYYVADPHIFDVVNLVALVYVMVRRPDVNTLSLAFIILAGRVLDSALLYNVDQWGGFVAYPVLILFNIAGILLIWFRPVIASKYGPGAMHDHDDFAVTEQDNVLGLLLTVQAIFQGLMLIEHATRLINPWMFEHSRILYDQYEVVQFVFAVIGVGILYFMTFDASKIKRSDRKKWRIEDGKQ